MGVFNFLKLAKVRLLTYERVRYKATNDNLKFIHKKVVNFLIIYITLKQRYVKHYSHNSSSAAFPCLTWRK